MAITGGRITATIYSKNRRDDITSPFGKPMNFPQAGVIIRDIPTSGSESYTSPAGVVCHSVIEVLPAGLNQRSQEYFSDQTTSALVTAGS